MNKIILIGNTGNDAELKTLESGVSVANFSLATTESWKDKEGNKQSKTTWHNCQIFGKRANIAPYIRKGGKLAITGQQMNDSTEKDGVRKYYSSVKVEDIELLSSRAESEPTITAPATQNQNDDLPF